MWFEKLMGFKEENPQQVKENIEVVDNKLISKINNREYVFGKLEIPSLKELRNQLNLKEKYNSQIKASEVVRCSSSLFGNFSASPSGIVFSVNL